LAALAVTVFLLAGATAASAYSVAVRWTSSDIPSAAGYRVYVRPAGGAERAPIDVAKPRHDGSGRFEIVIGDLQIETTYTFALSAYGWDGSESDRSNSYTIGYAQASAVVDSDHDGLTDAEEDVNKNQRLDDGESNRLVADTDFDGVPDGLEREFGSDPLDPESPNCGPLDFSEFRVVGSGTANVGYEAELDDLALATTPGGLFPTSIGVMYPQYGKGTLREPLFVTRVRTNDRFRIEIHARSVEGKLYRLRYEGRGHINRTTHRRMRRSLGDHFTGDRYTVLGFDVAGEIGRMDPGAVLDHVERITIRGSMLLQRPQICH
jgi:hypothetical protein